MTKEKAAEAVRKSHHLILVEGYTDVCAAHQVGVRNVGAVLGTSTTDDHAALVRRVGARRVQGNRVTRMHLRQVRPNKIEIDVVNIVRSRTDLRVFLDQRQDLSFINGVAG